MTSHSNKKIYCIFPKEFAVKYHYIYENYLTSCFKTVYILDLPLFNLTVSGWRLGVNGTAALILSRESS